MMRAQEALERAMKAHKQFIKYERKRIMKEIEQRANQGHDWLLLIGPLDPENSKWFESLGYEVNMHKISWSKQLT